MLSIYFRFIIFVNLMMFCFNANSYRFFEFSPNNPLCKILYIAGKTSEGAIYGAADLSFFGMLAQPVIESTWFPFKRRSSKSSILGKEIEGDESWFYDSLAYYFLILGAISGGVEGFYNGYHSVFNESLATNETTPEVSNTVISLDWDSEKAGSYDK